MTKFFLNFILTISFFSINAQPVKIDTVITSKDLYEIVSVLSSDKMNGRYTGSKEIDSAALYISKKFEEAGLYPVAGNNYYFQDFKVATKNGEVKATNIVGVIPRKDTTQDSIIIICAHYDHIGNGNLGAMKKDRNDNIYNGANDDAAGVAALIEIAKYYSILKENKYAILFIAFSAEEWGLIGSKYENEMLNSNLLKAVINMDMIGRPISKKMQKCMVISDNSTSIIKQLNESLNDVNKFFIEDQYPLEFLNSRADHASFPNCKNAFTLICTSPNDEFYHSPKDSIETINFPFLLKTTLNIAEACRLFIK
jgi:Zn-dependent M28 family amino/carboxypeptidase